MKDWVSGQEPCKGAINPDTIVNDNLTRLLQASSSPALGLCIHLEEAAHADMHVSLFVAGFQ